MTESGRKPRSKILLVAVIVALVGAGVAFWSWIYLSGAESTDDAQVDGHVNPVNVRVAGTITSVNVEENQRVEAGTVLVQLDTRDYENAISRAQADLADAKANYEAARAGVPVVAGETGSRVSSSQASLMHAQAGVESAEKEAEAARTRISLANARLVEAQASYAKASRDLDRMKRLVAKDEISQQQYDAAVAAADMGKAVVDSAQAAIVEAESGVAAAQARVKQAQGTFGQAEAEVQGANTGPQQVLSSKARVEAAAARIEQAKATLDQARLNLDYTAIKAPKSGIVSRKNVEVGQVVQTGQPLMAIVSLDDVWVVANFKETQLDKMRPGQPAEVSVDAYGGAKFAGRVKSIAPSTGAKFSLLPPENATGNYVKVVQRVPVRIELDREADPEHILRPGMSVVATVQVEAKK